MHVVWGSRTRIHLRLDCRCESRILVHLTRDECLLSIGPRADVSVIRTCQAVTRRRCAFHRTADAKRVSPPPLCILRCSWLKGSLPPQLQRVRSLSARRIGLPIK